MRVVARSRIARRCADGVRPAPRPAGSRDGRSPGPSRDPRGRVARRNGAHCGGRSRDCRRRPRGGCRQWRPQAGLRYLGDRRRPLAHGIDHQVDDRHAAGRAGARRAALPRRRVDDAAARRRDGGRLERLHPGPPADAYRGRCCQFPRRVPGRLARDRRGAGRGTTALHRRRARRRTRSCLRRALPVLQRRLHHRRPHRGDRRRRAVRDPDSEPRVPAARVDQRRFRPAQRRVRGSGAGRPRRPAARLRARPGPHRSLRVARRQFPAHRTGRNRPHDDRRSGALRCDPPRRRIRDRPGPAAPAELAAVARPVPGRLRSRLGFARSATGPAVP